MVPSSSILDAGSLHILEQLKYGKINIRQAAELLKVEPTILAYELAAKVFLMILTTVVSFIPFFVFGFCYFWQQSYKNTKILRICNYILQGNMGKT